FNHSFDVFVDKDTNRSLCAIERNKEQSNERSGACRVEHDDGMLARRSVEVNRCIYGIGGTGVVSGDRIGYRARRLNEPKRRIWESGKIFKVTRLAQQITERNRGLRMGDSDPCDGQINRDVPSHFDSFSIPLAKA